MNGKYTKKLGKKLAKQLNSKSKYNVYYAHGRKTKNDDVCRPTPFFGKCSAASTLSYVDIVIVEQKTKRVKLLCEIEESGAAPKKLIGDIVNIIVSEKLRIKGIDYEYDKPQLILGMKVKERGNSEQKAKDVIKRLKSIIKDSSWSQLSDIRILCDSDSDTLINRAESEIISLIK